MISITLQFPDAATAILAMTAVNRALTNAGVAEHQVEKTAVGRSSPQAGSDTAPVPQPAKDKPVGKPPAAAPAATPAAPAPAPAATTETAPESPSEVTYPQLQKAVQRLFSKSKEATAAVLKDLGVTHFSKLPADGYAKALAAVESKIAEVSK